MNILITGASSGIGLHLARDYLRDNHRVYCCGRNTAALQTLVHEFPSLARAMTFDVQNREDCQQALARVPQLNLVILNAGTCEYIEARQFDAGSFERVMRINVIGTANCLESLIPKMALGSRLALMGSISSDIPLPRAEAYGASKAAIAYLARTLAVSLQPAAIAVTYIAPGFVATPLTELNDFPMPMKVSVDFASKQIRAGLASGRSEIHFPKRFTWLLKCLALLPRAAQRALIAKTLVNH
ncbi:MAG: SDR family NAD(P)-dependent oxidoreductase [Gammaproteobacteria bacterium]|nr:SDR family NAD(P)-dependent oxidoreductase [Gammaproteobacteria bacterium]